MLPASCNNASEGPLQMGIWLGSARSNQDPRDILTAPLLCVYLGTIFLLQPSTFVNFPVFRSKEYAHLTATSLCPIRCQLTPLALLGTPTCKLASHCELLPSHKSH